MDALSALVVVVGMLCLYGLVVVLVAWPLLGDEPGGLNGFRDENLDTIISQFQSDQTDLSVDAFEARKALIRESFLAAQLQPPIQVESEQSDISNNQADDKDYTIWL